MVVETSCRMTLRWLFDHINLSELWADTAIPQMSHAYQTSLSLIPLHMHRMRKEKQTHDLAYNESSQ